MPHRTLITPRSPRRFVFPARFSRRTALSLDHATFSPPRPRPGVLGGSTPRAGDEGRRRLPKTLLRKGIGTRAAPQFSPWGRCGFAASRYVEGEACLGSPKEIFLTRR
jgi:hypothetical protein